MVQVETKPPNHERQKLSDRIFDIIEDRLYYAVVHFDLSTDEWTELCKLVLPERYDTPPPPPQPMTLFEGDSREDRVRIMQRRYMASQGIFHPRDIVPQPIRKQSEHEPRFRQATISDYDDDE